MSRIKLRSNESVGRPSTQSFMTAIQYNSALRILNMSKETAARFLKISTGTSFRYASGKGNIPLKVSAPLNAAVEAHFDTGDLPPVEFMRRRRTHEQFKEDQIAKMERRRPRWKDE